MALREIMNAIFYVLRCSCPWRSLPTDLPPWRAAYRWFALPRDNRLKVDVEDGRRWLQRNDARWDVMVIDAFYADSIPFHLTTVEFLELARSRLTPGGVIVTNIIGAIAGEQSRLLRSLTRTYRTVFPTVAFG